MSKRSKKYPDFYPRTVGDLKRELASLPDDMPVVFMDCEPVSSVFVEDGQLVVNDPLSNAEILAEIEEEECKEATGTVQSNDGDVAIVLDDDGCNYPRYRSEFQPIPTKEQFLRWYEVGKTLAELGWKEESEEKAVD